MIKITAQQVLYLCQSLVAATGGSDGIRDNGLLEAAVEAPFQSFGGQDLYPTVLQKAARLGYGLICNHPFLDGNKRTGAHTMLVFLALNGVQLSYTQQQLSQTIWQVASGKLSQQQLLEWLTNHKV